MDIQVLPVCNFRHGKRPLRCLHAGLYDALLITKQRKPQAVVLPYKELVIDSDSSSLFRITIAELGIHLSQHMREAANGHFFQVTKYNKPYLSLVSADWFFNQLEK